jgi:hypothetical protein
MLVHIRLQAAETGIQPSYFQTYINGTHVGVAREQLCSQATTQNLVSHNYVWFNDNIVACINDSWFVCGVEEIR